jgi:hypothetical protein
VPDLTMNSLKPGQLLRIHGIVMAILQLRLAGRDVKADRASNGCANRFTLFPCIGGTRFSAALRRGFHSPMWPSQSAAAKKVRTYNPLLYFSDYFSFVGRDTAGWVHFAIDNNRGHAGEIYQADHFIVMHDEQSGWVQLVGSEHYENAERQLERIPDSTYFVFRGALASGLIMQSAINDMRMSVGPLPQVLYRENSDGIFWLGGSPATLTWKQRTLKGRAIVEYLQRHNCFVADFTANWRNFNALYLMTDRNSDVYMHYHEREGGSDLNGKIVGFASWGTPAPIADIEFYIARTEPADGEKYS